MGSSDSGRRLHASQVQHEQSAAPFSVVIQPAPPAELGGSSPILDCDTDRRLYGTTAHPEAVPTTRSEEMPIKVLIADDHAIVRDGIVALLESQLDTQLVGEAADGKEAVAMGLCPS